MENENRTKDLEHLLRISRAGGPALLVVWGRKRLGRSNLLARWSNRARGTYWVADQTSAAIQRTYLARELDHVLPGFSTITYPDWRTLLDQLSRHAATARWRGPLIIDEFPCLVSAAPELPDELRKWVEREKQEGGLLLALAGFTRRGIMESLATDAPLLELEPPPPGQGARSVGMAEGQSILDYYTCWGGVPRYWELAQPYGSRHRDAVDALVLSPQGALHNEVNQQLHLELPPAITLRPILDAIALGAHRITEIAEQLHLPATSLPRGIRQLQDLGYIRREVPWGEDETRSRKAQYHLSEPFLRLWFRAVAPHRGALRTATRPERLRKLEQVWTQLRTEAWQEACRLAIPHMELFDRTWYPAGRTWSTRHSDWDIVSSSVEEDTIILGECRNLARPAEQKDLEKMMRTIMTKTVPAAINETNARIEFVLFVPEIATPGRAAPAAAAGVYELSPGLTAVDAKHVFEALAGGE